MQTLFDIKNIPKETQMREIIDKTESKYFLDIFKDIHSRLEQTDIIKQYQLFPDLYLFPFDGTSYFSSGKIHCKQCLTKKRHTVFHLEILSDKSKKVIRQSHWVTDLEVTKDNIKVLVRGGRCRWKAENECFNTLVPSCTKEIW